MYTNEKQVARRVKRIVHNALTIRSVHCALTYMSIMCTARRALTLPVSQYEGNTLPPVAGVLFTCDPNKALCHSTAYVLVAGNQDRKRKFGNTQNNRPVRTVTFYEFRNCSVFEALVSS
jgi:hypothetical protein